MDWIFNRRKITTLDWLWVFSTREELHSGYSHALQHAMAESNPPEPECGVSRRAYELWEQRGSPGGSPDIDWFQAEHEAFDWFREMQMAAYANLS